MIEIKNFAPVIEKQKQVFHTKDPFLVKRLPSLKTRIIGNILDGYYALILSKCELPDEVISLNVSDQKLNGVNEYEMSFFENLHIITANKNDLRLDHFFKITGLRHLHLDQNNILKLPSLKNRFDSLQKLSLSFNRIQNISELAHLSSLTSLSLAGNHLDRFGEEFCSLTQLEELDLSCNKISEEKCWDLWKTLSQLP